MPIEVKLPNLGDGIDTGDVLELLVKEGDIVAQEQGIIELETGKATLQVPSSAAGKIWHWTGVTEALRLLALLVEENVPLPTALALTSRGVADANVGQYCGTLAKEVESGRVFSELLGKTGRLPPLLAPLVRWGEVTSALPEALRTASDVLEERARRRIELLRVVLPPILFVIVASSAAFLIVGIVAPLLQLIQGLGRF